MNNNCLLRDNYLPDLEYISWFRPNQIRKSLIYLGIFQNNGFKQNLYSNVPITVLSCNKPIKINKKSECILVSCQVRISE